MGFFKFLNKKEKGMDNMDMSDLEMPPAPESMDDMPEMKDEPKFDLDDDFSIPYKEEEADDFEEEPQELPKQKSTQRVTNKPLYVKADVYRDVITEMMHVKELLKRSDEGISRIGSDINGENKEFDRWHNTLKDIQRRMLMVDKNLFKR